MQRLHFSKYIELVSSSPPSVHAPKGVALTWQASFPPPMSPAHSMSELKSGYLALHTLSERMEIFSCWRGSGSGRGTEEREESSQEIVPLDPIKLQLAALILFSFTGCCELTFKDTVNILVSYETRRLKESINTNHAMLTLKQETQRCQRMYGFFYVC